MELRHQTEYLYQQKLEKRITWEQKLVEFIWRLHKLLLLLDQPTSPSPPPSSCGAPPPLPPPSSSSSPPAAGCRPGGPAGLALVSGRWALPSGGAGTSSSSRKPGSSSEWPRCTAAASCTASCVQDSINRSDNPLTNTDSVSQKVFDITVESSVGGVVPGHVAHDVRLDDHGRFQHLHLPLLLQPMLQRLPKKDLRGEEEKVRK